MTNKRTPEQWESKKRERENETHRLIYEIIEEELDGKSIDEQLAFFKEFPIWAEYIHLAKNIVDPKVQFMLL